MIEEQKASGDLPKNSVSNSAGTEDTVAYSTYQKVLNERKNDREKARAAEARLLEIENKLFEAEGNKDGVIEAGKLRYEKAESELKDLKTRTISDKVNNQIKMAAQKQGCVNTEKYLRLIGSAELDTIKESIDTDFNIDANALSELIEKSKQEHSDIGLFKKPDVLVHDVNGNFKPKAKVKTLAEMSAEEVKEYAKNNL